MYKLIYLKGRILIMKCVGGGVCKQSLTRNSSCPCFLNRRPIRVVHTFRNGKASSGFFLPFRETGGMTECFQRWPLITPETIVWCLLIHCCDALGKCDGWGVKNLFSNVIPCKKNCREMLYCHCSQSLLADFQNTNNMSNAFRRPVKNNSFLK